MAAHNMSHLVRICSHLIGLSGAPERRAKNNRMWEGGGEERGREGGEARGARSWLQAAWATSTNYQDEYSGCQSKWTERGEGRERRGLDERKEGREMQNREIMDIEERIRSKRPLLLATEPNSLT